MAHTIRIIGTSHISSQSKAQVERIIRELKPEYVCVELDARRLAGLRSGITHTPSARELIRNVGVQGYIFSLVAGWAQKKLGAHVDAKPGQEMLRAVIVARDVGAKVALIDQDILITLQRLHLPWRERFRIIVDIIKGLFGFGKTMKFDLHKVPEKSMINLLLDETKERYPTLYRVLVTERNEIMAKRIARISRNCEGTIVAVIGAGHETEVMRKVSMLVASADRVETLNSAPKQNQFKAL